MKNKDLQGIYPFTVREVKTTTTKTDGLLKLEVRMRVQTGITETQDIYENIMLTTDKKYWWKTKAFFTCIKAPPFVVNNAGETLEGLKGTAKFGLNRWGSGSEVKEFIYGKN